MATNAGLSIGATVGPQGAVAHQMPTVPMAYIDRPDTVSVFEFVVAGSSPPVSVVGNGVTDDSAAVNAALAALAGSGISLYFPQGTYLVTTNAIVNPGVNCIFGAGALVTGTHAQALLQGGAAPMYARAIMTTVATSTTYTGTGTNVLTFGSNAAIGTQDGVATLAVGDVVILQGGTLGSCAITAADVGPWIITAAGGASAKVVLTRPNWWSTGSVLPTLSRIQIGPEGTLFGGTAWSTWAVAGKTTGTDDPLLYPDRVSTQVTLAASTATLSTVPIRSATASGFFFALAAVGGTTTSTVGYGTIAAPTAGYIGTCTMAVDALAAGMTKNGAADDSIVSCLIVNRP